MTQYAVEIDETYDAVLLRDLCRREAQKAHTRWATSSSRAAVQRNARLYERFAMYAERFEHIRKQEAERIAATLGTP